MHDLFYKNRRLLMLAIALIVVTGLSSVYVLPRLEDPVLKQRASLIHTSFPGANAVRVETLVTEPMEDALKEIEEIRFIRSASRDEMSTITLELKDYVDEVEPVWSRVRDKLADVEPLLPAGADKPHFIDLKFTAYAALYALEWSGDGPLNEAILGRYAEQLEQKLRSLPGTDDVDLFGMSAEEIVIEIDHHELADLNLTPGDVARAIRASDAKVSAGGLRGESRDIVVEVASEFETLERIASTPLKTNVDGTVVSLGDVGRVEKSVVDPPQTRTLINGEQSIVLGCFIQPDMRIDWWTAEAGAMLDEFRRELPAGIIIEPIFVQDRYVTQRLSKLLLNLGLGATAVTFVILLMMGWRSAIVIGSALPLAGLMVLGGLRFMEIPLHQMSVTGLIIALGLLIDNAIVAVDEMRSRLQSGLSPSEAIRATVRQLAIPLMGSTFTTCLAFAPLAVMPGPAGEFVGSIGISVILAVTSSLFLSLTLVPALVAILQGHATTQNNGGLLQHGFGNKAMYRWYRKSLDLLFAKPFLGLMLGVLLPLLGFSVFNQLPEQFFPPSDREQFRISMRLPPQSAISETIAAAQMARDLALEFDEIERVHWFVGESAPAFYYNMLPVRNGVPNYAQAMVQSRAGVDITELVQRVQEKLQNDIPGAQIIVRQLEQGPPVDAPIMVRVVGQDLPTIKQVGDELRLILASIPEVVSTSSDVGSSTAKLELQVNEDEALLAGLNHLEIASQLRTALDGEIGGSLVEGTEVLPVRIKWAGEQKANSKSLRSFALIAPGNRGAGVRVPVESIADWKLVPDSTNIDRFDGYRMNEIQVHVEAGVLSSVVLKEFQARLEAAGYKPPAGVSINFAGQSSERNRAVNNLLGSAGVLLVLMVAGLVLSFQSFRLAGLIAVVGGLSVGLGLAALWGFGYPFGFMAIVGIMGLVGVAINDSIVVLAAIRSDSQAKLGDRQAIANVVFHSTRHVFSTTLTTIAGFIPLLLSGGGFWPPLAIAIAGGVSGATILALYFAPSAYLVLFGRAAGGQDRARENLDNLTAA
ncbi:MAG: efflux RND transporter permease subunit [Pirellulaceae bacterium]|nr:efflux RND transporter permease subunit [Pirellulaceae bacterium]